MRFQFRLFPLEFGFLGGLETYADGSLGDKVGVLELLGLRVAGHLGNRLGDRGHVELRHLLLL